MGETMKLRPKCLAFGEDEIKGAAYTSDGYMLPCCWLDQPQAERQVIAFGLRDDELLLSKNEKLEDIFTSNQWENFFQTLVNKPEESCFICKKKCGNKIDESEWLLEEKTEFYNIKILSTTNRNCYTSFTL